MLNNTGRENNNNKKWAIQLFLSNFDSGKTHIEPKYMMKYICLQPIPLLHPLAA